MDAKTFLEASRRQIIKMLTVSLAATCGCLVIGFAILFILTLNVGVAIILALLLLCLLGYGTTLMLIKRRPIWQLVLPITVALLLMTVGVGILLPELGLFVA